MIVNNLLLYCKVNIIPADDLTANTTRASAGMILNLWIQKLRNPNPYGPKNLIQIRRFFFFYYTD